MNIFETTKNEKNYYDRFIETIIDNNFSNLFAVFVDNKLTSVTLCSEVCLSQ